MELAFAVNAGHVKSQMPGWKAVLERRRVDVTLVRAGGEQEDTEEVPIELKLVGTDWWNTAWRDVVLDICGKPGSRKPQAHYEVCVMYDVLSNGGSQRRARTAKQYAECLPYPRTGEVVRADRRRLGTLLQLRIPGP